MSSAPSWQRRPEPSIIAAVGRAEADIDLTAHERMDIITRRPVRAPHVVLRAAEAAWLPLEAMGFWALRPLLRLTGAGDQHPVLILPGFYSDDTWTMPLRWALRGQGYWVYGWRLGRNIGPTTKIVDGMLDRIAQLHREHDRTVTLIGHSLGGIFARILARKEPEAVRQVITLGSPYRLVEGDRTGVPKALWEQYRPLHDARLPLLDVREEDREPLTVPATSIYSRTDGVAPWQTCIDTRGENAENIEVRGSHIGMSVNPAVILAVLDRLAQPEGDWRPFAPPSALRPWYPRPASWRDTSLDRARRR